MALVALDGLGAPDERLMACAAEYSNRLVPIATPPPAAAASAISLGTYSRYPDFLAAYSGSIEERGSSEVLAQELPRLLNGVGGAAFHGLIRLGYAIDHGRGGDVAAGLAYLADTHQPVPPAAGRSTFPEVFEQLRAVVTEPGGTPIEGHGEVSSGFPIAFRRVARDATFCEISAQLEANENLLAEVRLAAHDLFALTHDFFALHTMTGCHAARLVMTELSDTETRAQLGATTAISVLAAWVVVGAPEFEPLSAAGTERFDAEAWQRTSALVVGSNDEHVIKLVYTAMRESAAYGDDRYLATAGGAFTRESSGERAFTGLGG